VRHLSSILKNVGGVSRSVFVGCSVPWMNVAFQGQSKFPLVACRSPVEVQDQKNDPFPHSCASNGSSTTWNRGAGIFGSLARLGEVA
jgi:hypothetical protein